MGVLGDQRLELADQVGVAAEREVGLDPFLDRRQAQVLEPSDLCLRERLERELGQRRAAPERERLVQRVGGALRRRRRERPTAFGEQPLERRRSSSSGATSSR